MVSLTYNQWIMSVVGSVSPEAAKSVCVSLWKERLGEKENVYVSESSVCSGSEKLLNDKWLVCCGGQAENSGVARSDGNGK